jgi:hypothetical protein
VAAVDCPDSTRVGGGGATVGGVVAASSAGSKRVSGRSDSGPDDDEVMDAPRNGRKLHSTL